MFSHRRFPTLFSDKVGKTICLADDTSLYHSQTGGIHAAHHDSKCWFYFVVLAAWISYIKETITPKKYLYEKAPVTFYLLFLPHAAAVL